LKRPEAPALLAIGSAALVASGVNPYDRLTWFLEVLPILVGVQLASVYTRSRLSHWAIRSLGMAAVAVLKLHGISQSAVTRASIEAMRSFKKTIMKG
jgi:uncharacterized membrane protein YjdF